MSIKLSKKSKIYVHIVDIDEKDFQWYTHPRTFQILEHDTFDILRTKIINKLSSKYPKEEANTITCLNERNKLKIFIDKRASDEQKAAAMLQKSKIHQSFIALNDNIWNAIKINKPNNAQNDEICIWFIANNNIINTPNIFDTDVTTIHSINHEQSNNNKPKKKKRQSKIYDESNLFSISISDLNTNNYRIPKRNNITNKKRNKRKKSMNDTVNKNSVYRKTIERIPKKQRAKCVPKKRRQVKEYNYRSNINTKTVRNKNTKKSNNSKRINSIKSYKKQKSIQKHTINHNESIKSNLNRNNSELSDMTLLTKNKINKKRKRIALNNKNNKSEPLNKKQKKQRIIDWNGECIWLFIDFGHTMSTSFLDDTTKIEVARILLETMLNNTWAKPECESNHIRLFTFSDKLQDLTGEPSIRYSHQEANRLLNYFDQVMGKVDNMEYENCINYKHALQQLIDKIKYIKENELTMDYPVLKRNRILLLTDGERGNIHMDHISCKEMKKKLGRHGIILDVVQICSTRRRVEFLETLCTDDNVGKYFNPVNKTINDYQAIMTSDIMCQVKLRDSRNNVIELLD